MTLRFAVLSMVLMLLCNPLTQALAQQYSYYAQVLCKDPRYHCVKARGGWSLFKDSRKREIVRRINRLNTAPRAGMLIAVPNFGDFKNILDYAPFPKYLDKLAQQVPQPLTQDYHPKFRRTIIYDPKLMAWAAYSEYGELVRWGPGAAGKAFCPDIRKGCRTKVGEFTMYDKRGGGCYSRQYPVGRGGAKTPYCMFFHGGYAFHGSRTVPGRHASHGCIRIYGEDAKWLNQEFITIKNKKTGHPGTEVIVLPYGKFRTDYES